MVGVTLTGNKGGTSMLYAALDALRAPDDSIRFDLISVYPGRDRVENDIDVLRIVPAPPLVLIAHLPVAVLTWPLARARLGRRLLSLSPVFRALLSADVVIDLSGIAFSDGRGLPVLVYNLAVVAPALLFGRRVAKLAQALGPFRTPLNRCCARWVLPRCEVVVARGPTTASHVSALGLDGVRVLSDTAFAMHVDADTEREAVRILDEAGVGSPLVVVVPSRVVRTRCERVGIDYVKEMRQLIERLNGAGFAALLLAHSTAAAGKTNDDLTVVRQIGNGLSGRTVVMDAELDARLLRAIIGRADFFVGSRFHAMVSALTMKVPSLVVGWGHKYAEVFGDLGLHGWVVDWRECRASILFSHFEHLEQCADEVRRTLNERLPPVVERAQENFSLVRGILERGDLDE